MSMIVDPEVVRGGDPALFARLFEENRPRLLALAYRLTASQPDAEDVVQDAFVSSFRSRGGFQGNASPSTWLYKVTLRAALMKLRTRRRKGAQSLDALPAEVAHAEVHAARARIAPVDSPEDVAARAPLRAALGDALEELDPLDRRVVLLRLVDELSTDEVGTAVGASPSAVRSRLCRARHSLRGALEGDAVAAP